MVEDRKLLVCTGVLFFALLFLLTVRLNVLKSSYEIEQVRKEALENDSSLRQLKLSYATITSPMQLITEAENRLALLPTETANMRGL